MSNYGVNWGEMSAEFKLKDKKFWSTYPISNLIKGIGLLEFLEETKISKSFFEKGAADAAPISDHLCFVCYKGQLGLYSTELSGIAPTTINLDSTQLIERKDPLSLALRNDRNKLIIDTTAGLLGDSLRLRSIGFNVLAFEQNFVLQTLITEAFQKTKLDRLKFIPQRFSWDVLEKVDEQCVIIYDPYFRKKETSSKPKGKFQVLRFLDSLEENLRLSDCKRSGLKVLVKRPLKAPQIWKSNLSQSYKGKSIRYDLYITS